MPWSLALLTLASRVGMMARQLQAWTLQPTGSECPRTKSALQHCSWACLLVEAAADVLPIGLTGHPAKAVYPSWVASI